MSKNVETGLSFCVVIPMHNESAGAEACVREVCAVLDKLPMRCALLVVEDGSRDNTARILETIAPQYPKFEVIRHPRNMGYGSALRTGMERAARDGYDYALFMDSDLTNDPADIPRFVEQMKAGADVIKASRFTGEGGMSGVPFKRAVFSRTGNLVARALFGIGLRDCTNGFRAVRVAILEQMNLTENGFPIIVEELYQCKLLAKSYAEVPVVLTSRTDDQRPTAFSYKPATFYKYFCYALKARFKIRFSQK